MTWPINFYKCCDFTTFIFALWIVHDCYMIYWLGYMYNVKLSIKPNKEHVDPFLKTLEGGGSANPWLKVGRATCLPDEWWQLSMFHFLAEELQCPALNHGLAAGGLRNVAAGLQRRGCESWAAPLAGVVDQNPPCSRKIRLDLKTRF